MAKKQNATAKVEEPTSTEALKEALDNEELVAEAAIDILTEEEPTEEISEDAPASEEPAEKTPAEETPAEEPKEEAPEEKPEEPKASKADAIATADVIVINTSYNPICLQGPLKGQSVQIAPKEMKRVPRALYRELMKQKIVRAWFDKGVLTSNADANEEDANEAVAPKELSTPVTQNGSTAELKKFQKDGTFKIEL